jgi:hypothetical protein
MSGRSQDTSMADELAPSIGRCAGARTLAACIILLVIAACARPMPEWDEMSGLAVCDSVPLPLKPGEPVGATLPGDVRPSPDSGTAIGTVTEAESGRTMLGAAVAFLALPASDSTRRPRRGTVTSPAGGFEVRSLVPGAYRLRVLRIGQRPHEREVDVRAGAIDTFLVQVRPLRCSSY